MYDYPRLRDMREDHDLTQTDVAKLLKITQTQYSFYETGAREIRLHHVVSLAKFYNISIDYLAGLAAEPRPLYLE